MEFSMLVREWRQNQRLRLAVWLMVGILLLYVSLLVSDWRTAVQEDYRRTAERLSRLEALTKQSEWTTRADASRALCVQLEGGLWKAEGRGMALAALQNWIYGLLKGSALDDSRVSVEPAIDVPGVEHVWQVAVRVEGALHMQKLAVLLHQIETHPQMTEIDGLEITAGTQGRFALVLKAYFLAGAA